MVLLVKSVCHQKIECPLFTVKIILAIPSKIPAIKPENAPVALVLFQKIPKINAATIGGAIIDNIS